MSVLEFAHVDIVFPGPGRDRPSSVTAALALLDAGHSRAEIAERSGAVVGVSDANLKVEHGEISVLMGLSGSGKSTLLRAANGLNRVTRGRVLVADGPATVDVAACDALTLRRIRRQRIAMVFQQFGLLPWRTVADNVGFGLELRGDAPSDRQRVVADKLALVGLSEWASRHVSELSGGMQQRVGLARAFATDADVLLMDEPFSALDPLIRGKLQDELLSLQERVKKTILFVSHDLDEALKLGDRITILEGGRIVQSGTAQDIVLNPADEYVAEFVRHMNPMTVLTGAMIMRPIAELSPASAGVWLDPRQRYRLLLDGNHRPTGIELDGAACAIRLVADDSALPTDGVAVAPRELALRSIVRLAQSTGHPVVLVDGGRLSGVCTETDIVRALAGDRAARRPSRGAPG
jgi:glycine betaine/proline transport system ATP-binding protein